MFTPDFIRSAGGRLALSLMVLLAMASPLAAQSATPTGKWRLTAISGGLAHPSAVVEDAVGGSDTRLSPGATFGLDVQYSAFSFGAVYGTLAGSFSTLEHGGGPADHVERVFTTPHSADLGAISAGYGVPHQRVTSLPALVTALGEPLDRLSVIEAKVDGLPRSRR